MTAAALRAAQRRYLKRYQHARPTFALDAADEAALDGGDVTEPDSAYNHARVLDVLERLTAALAPLTFTERCAWCGTAIAVVIGEQTGRDGRMSVSRDPACIACCKERRLVAVRSLIPQTLAEREAEPVMQA